MQMNRIGTAKNPYQGNYKKVLCVCSAGCLRSPTAAVVLSQEPFNFNTRAAGLDSEFAIIPLDDVLLQWADEIVCMDDCQYQELRELTDKPLMNLGIGDEYRYRDPELMELIARNYKNALAKMKLVEDAPPQK